MDGFFVDVEDNVSARLATVEAAVRGSLVSAAETLRRELYSLVVAKAGGEVLKVRTGRFVDSLKSSTEVGDGGVVTTVSSDAPQAIILEYGGEIPAHEIVPVNAKALRFAGSAGAVYASAVHVPDVNIPEHSYLRSALHEIETEIAVMLAEEAVEAVVAVLLL